jgi:AraC-type DNA-binding domain-containing proteins
MTVRSRRNFFKGFQILRGQGRAAQRDFELQIHRMLGMLYDWGVDHRGRKTTDGVLLREYLDQNWQRSVTLAELSALIHKSPAQTLRIFHRDWNTSPYAYLQEQRSFFARQYLENTDCPVKELSAKLGFPDEFYSPTGSNRKTIFPRPPTGNSSEKTADRAIRRSQPFPLFPLFPLPE